MQQLDGGWARAWIRECARVIAEQRVALMELDRAIGDGDHGENLDRGFSAAAARLAEFAADSPGEVLRLTAATLMSTVGGAAGPLYGTAFLRAARTAGDDDLDPGRLAAMLQAAGGGSTRRGRARAGGEAEARAEGRDAATA